MTTLRGGAWLRTLIAPFRTHKPGIINTPPRDSRSPPVPERVAGCYNTRIRRVGSAFVPGYELLRTQISTLFHETVNFCFGNALDGMGPTVRDVIYDLLAKKGIVQSEISSRFDDVVAILTDSLGASARVIIYRTMTLLCQEYQMRADFSYQDSLKDRMVMLKDRVVADHLYPKRAQRNDPIFATPNTNQLGQNP